MPASSEGNHGGCPYKRVACCVNGMTMKKKLVGLAVLTVIFALVQFVDAAAGEELAKNDVRG
jgi:hypothetical protein